MKKILCTSLFLLLIVLCTGAIAASSGTCGESVTWTLDDNGTLTISGTGAMTNTYWEEPDFGWDKNQVRIVMIENGVTEIGDGAFNSCPNLTSIFIPASVTSIAKHDEDIKYDVADHCPNLKEYVVASENQTYCTKDGVLFSKDMKYLYRCPQGKTGKYIVPEQVEVIYGSLRTSSEDANREEAFSNCSRLTEVVFLDGVQSIGNCSFSGCSAIKSITLSDSITHIGFGAFSFCTNLNEITVPDSVVSIEGYAFQNCSSLTNITIPGHVKQMGESVFYGCSSLTSVTMACDAFWSVFYGCSSLTDVTFLDGAKKIEGCAFRECTALKSLVIPDSLTTIDSGRESNPFLDCQKLSSITVSAKNKSAIRFFTEHGFSKALNILDVSMTDCEVGGIADQEYTGKAIKPKTTVKYIGVSLKEGKDYSLSYADNINVGKASVTITGIGNCSGQKTVTFIINPKAVTLSSLKAGEKYLTVKWKKGSGIDGYEIQYSLKKNFKNAKTIRISKVETTSTVLEGLKAKKTYYVRIRTFKKVKGKKYYSEWSKVLSKKTK